MEPLSHFGSKSFLYPPTNSTRAYPKREFQLSLKIPFLMNEKNEGTTPPFLPKT